MDFLGIISFVLVLGVIVAIHELGHLVAAKAFGVYCAEYAVGMGPKLFSIQGKETKYSIRLLPVGGYVMMAGETDSDQSVFPEDLPAHRTVNGLNPWKRMIVQLAGIIMNMILGIVIFTIVFFSWGSPYSSSNQIASILEDSPARQAGLMTGDKVIAMTVDGTRYEVTNFEDMNDPKMNPQSPRLYEIERDGSTFEVELVPKYVADSDQYLVGLAFSAQPLNFIEAIGVGFQYTAQSALLIFTVLGQLFKGIGLENLSGPVGIYSVTSQVATQGFMPLLFLTGILSVNVGVLQLLPLPALDGGRVVFSLWEGLTGKPIPRKLESTLILISFALLLLLIVFVTYKDIVNLF